jgi:hypothetical protein
MKNIIIYKYYYTKMNQNQNKFVITNMDLCKKNNYGEEDLIYNIDILCPSIILKTQKKLSNNFIKNYILNEKYAKIREDSDITIYDLCNFYPNFTF